MRTSGNIAGICASNMAQMWETTPLTHPDGTNSSRNSYFLSRTQRILWAKPPINGTFRALSSHFSTHPAAYGPIDPIPTRRDAPRSGRRTPGDLLERDPRTPSHTAAGGLRSSQLRAESVEIDRIRPAYLRIPLLFPTFTARISGVSNKRTTPALDATSKAIIEQLQRDGRRSYAEIGKAVGLSEAAVRQRVQKLTDAGVMQIVAVTDPMRLGFSRQAMLGIRVSGDTRVVADRLAEMPEISYVVLSAGSFDILVEVVCEDDDGLIELLNEKIRGIDGVASTETFVYLQLTKQKYDWGTR